MPANLKRILDGGWSIGKKTGLGTELEAHITYINNHVLSKAGLKIGVGSTTRVEIANNTDYTLNGIVYRIPADQEEAFTATDHDIADGYTNIFNMSVNAALATTLTIGTPALAGVAPTVAATPAGQLCIGTIQITAVGAIFNASTDALDAGHLTVVYIDRDGYVAIQPSLDRDMLG